MGWYGGECDFGDLCYGGSVFDLLCFGWDIECEVLCYCCGLKGYMCLDEWICEDVCEWFVYVFEIDVSDVIV